MSIPTKEENPTGFHAKYHITKINGEPLDPEFEGFLLRLDESGDPAHVNASRFAIIAYAYAYAISADLPDLAADLFDRYAPKAAR